MSEALRTISTDGLLAPTHVISRPVTAFRICAADEIATHRRVTVLASGEVAHVHVPDDFCRAGTPVTGDWLLVSLVGEVSHCRAELFEQESIPVARAAAGCITDEVHLRNPRFPG
ncbi:hypothetical protein [Methylobacterium sp. B1]|uniref:hypothetical protein n=1 Tax=Methylobacterium sp. B1 TaxID=91459 RepID=UPI00034DD8F2|nr:hypothetical protein [Methylobacterium sp. B1]